MNYTELWIAHLDLYFWIAVLTGSGGLIIGIMCLWKLRQIADLSTSRYKELLGRYEKIIHMLNAEADVIHEKRIIPPSKR